MHSGRTIEELIKLVQRINPLHGAYANTARALSDPASTKSSPSSRRAQERTEPAWLAAFQ